MLLNIFLFLLGVWLGTLLDRKVKLLYETSKAYNVGFLDGKTGQKDTIKTSILIALPSKEYFEKLGISKEELLK